MAVKYEWKVTRAGRRYVRSVVPDEVVIVAEPEAVAEPVKRAYTRKTKAEPKPVPEPVESDAEVVIDDD